MSVAIEMSICGSEELRIGIRGLEMVGCDCAHCSFLFFIVVVVVYGPGPSSKKTVTIWQGQFHKI